MIRKVLALILSILTGLLPTVAAAAPPVIPGFYGTIPLPAVAPNALPAQKTGGAFSGVTNVVTDTAAGQMTVNQNQPRAIIDWSSFNIGANAWVRFNQKDTAGAPKTDWVALNRIYDANPTQIYGKLSADGKVFLINRNGILFGPGSQVDTHSLVASSLRMYNVLQDKSFSDPAFLDPSTSAELLFTDTDPGTPGVVANHGTIQTEIGRAHV